MHCPSRLSRHKTGACLHPYCLVLHYCLFFAGGGDPVGQSVALCRQVCVYEDNMVDNLVALRCHLCLHFHNLVALRCYLCIHAVQNVNAYGNHRARLPSKRICCGDAGPSVSLRRVPGECLRAASCYRYSIEPPPSRARGVPTPISCHSLSPLCEQGRLQLLPPTRRAATQPPDLARLPGQAVWS